MSVLFMYVPAAIDNALPYDDLMAADDVVQAVADYTAAYIGEEQYNATAGIWGSVWTWLYMGLGESEVHALLDTFIFPS
ncbi:hypothetical protein [Pseudomonas sp. MN1F]|uniref:hypothetical protein n=1 Tax=Pseudomonas sp. MN1F TaxID=1366632 RepID=UPI00128F9EA0|nr:hypothetical protein [Pseudomonas sp. MN1F]MQG91331.1 hypothetical protein [Pseudomonas sp. MN1F]